MAIIVLVTSKVNKDPGRCLIGYRLSGFHLIGYKLSADFVFRILPIAINTASCNGLDWFLVVLCMKSCMVGLRFRGYEFEYSSRHVHFVQASCIYLALLWIS